MLLCGLGSALKHLDKLSAPQRPFPIYIKIYSYYYIISIMIVLSDTSTHNIYYGIQVKEPVLIRRLKRSLRYIQKPFSEEVELIFLIEIC